MTVLHILKVVFPLDGNKLWLSKIGEMEFWLHRHIEGFAKRLTIHRSATKKWYVSFLIEGFIDHILEPSEKVVGIDMSITNFAVLFDCGFANDAKFLSKDEDKLKAIKSKRDKLPKGSPERRKASKFVSHLIDRVANRRENFPQQLSRKWIDTYGIICFKDLNITKDGS